jgi:phosphoribosylanthranilate isomerase
MIPEPSKICGMYGKIEMAAVTRFGQLALVLIFLLGQIFFKPTRRRLRCRCMIPEPSKICGMYGKIEMAAVPRFGQLALVLIFLWVKYSLN